METFHGKGSLLELSSVFMSPFRLHRLDESCLLQFLILLLPFKHLFAHIELLTLSFLRVKWIIIQSRRHNLVQLSMAWCCSLWLEANFPSIFHVLWLLQLSIWDRWYKYLFKAFFKWTLGRFNVCDFFFFRIKLNEAMNLEVDILSQVGWQCFC